MSLNRTRSKTDHEILPKTPIDLLSELKKINDAKTIQTRLKILREKNYAKKLDLADPLGVICYALTTNNIRSVKLTSLEKAMVMIFLDAPSTDESKNAQLSNTMSDINKIFAEVPQLKLAIDLTLSYLRMVHPDHATQHAENEQQFIELAKRQIDNPLINLPKIQLENIDLSNAYLPWANLKDAVLTNVNLSHANLSHANLRCATLLGVNIEETDIANANVEYMQHISPAAYQLKLALLNIKNSSVIPSVETLTDALSLLEEDPISYRERNKTTGHHLFRPQYQEEVAYNLIKLTDQLNPELSYQLIHTALSHPFFKMHLSNKVDHWMNAAHVLFSKEPKEKQSSGRKLLDNKLSQYNQQRTTPAPSLEKAPTINMP